MIDSWSCSNAKIPNLHRLRYPLHTRFTTSTIISLSPLPFRPLARRVLLSAWTTWKGSASCPSPLYQPRPLSSISTTPGRQLPHTISAANRTAIAMGDARSGRQRGGSFDDVNRVGGEGSVCVRGASGASGATSVGSGGDNDHAEDGRRHDSRHILLSPRPARDVEGIPLASDVGKSTRNSVTIGRVTAASSTSATGIETVVGESGAVSATGRRTRKEEPAGTTRDKDEVWRQRRAVLRECLYATHTTTVT